MASAAVQPSSNPFADARDRRKTQAPKKEIWSTLLNSVSSGKRLPEKQLLLLGGSPQSQKDFLESLSTDTSSNRRQQTRRPPPVANQYALGYTYQDVLDADHEDILARLSIYTLSSASTSFAPLLKPLLTPKTLSHTLVVILLDWNQPWHWVRQLRDWIRLIRSIVVSLDDESKNAMEDNVSRWRDRQRNRSNTVESTESGDAEDASLPLGPGEWDEPLGMPLCVVCQNTDKMQSLERDHGWKDEQFDYIGQYIRTILLKHGGSLIYTMPSAPGSLQPLVHSSLGITSTLLAQKKELGYEVSNRDRTLVPPNWDSWAKIRMMADNFDPEIVSKMWSVEIQKPSGSEPTGEDETNAVSMYEADITNPKANAAMPGGMPKAGAKGVIEVESKDVQSFLAEQSKILEEFQVADRKERMAQESKKDASRLGSLLDDGGRHVEEHIGPVQFNMGGIQVDAEEMVRKIKDREATRSMEEPSRLKSPSTPKAAVGGGDNAEMENQRLKDFFANLAKKSGGGSANSPRRGPEAAS
ncbi:uncharacterized protein PV09_04331 [Verruconis gallopava]|uniref:Dynein light intermediate chain n=1 Tax=Verruconis gallopava TaxID=253628 RepID=A0A0D1YV97_9PEZI|nr:uncharacterized protein PV09_04331 [Verruconis gallopava]KIW04582.1 hypothetical protein PV09_04331 [Verruconis gallopava]